MTATRSSKRNARSPRRQLEPRVSVPQERWADVAAAVAAHGLREAGRLFGISHETARAIARRCAASAECASASVSA